jgi:uracil-DNA glycosylase
MSSDSVGLKEEGPEPSKKFLKTSATTFKDKDNSIMRSSSSQSPPDTEKAMTKAETEKPRTKEDEVWEPFSYVNGTWNTLLSKEVKKPYFVRLTKFVDAECGHKKIFPPRHQIFNALQLCTFEDVRVVIIGQDPYHGPDQAHGLSFSVQRGVKIPPSLRNIYKEIQNDIGHKPPTHGCLEDWSKQGVLMLNACLTVRSGEANSHSKKGWEDFTDAIIRLVSKNSDGCVFLLWGKPAALKCSTIDTKKHRVISSSHPSPLGATKTDKPFIGSKCFSRCNQQLIEMGKKPIDWKLKS